MRKLVNASADRIAKGFNPFTGPIVDNTGVVQIKAGESLGRRQDGRLQVVCRRGRRQGPVRNEPERKNRGGERGNASPHHGGRPGAGGRGAGRRGHPRNEGQVDPPLGAPVDWSRMCGAQRGAVIGMCIFEGWAKDREDAERQIAAGRSPSSPTIITRPSARWPAPSPATCGSGWWRTRPSATGPSAARWKASSSSGTTRRTPSPRLEKWRDVWGPALRAAVRKMGGVPLKQLISRALLMGDEMHNRVVASSSIFTNAVAPALVDCGLPKEQVLSTLYYAGNHPFLFLGLSMAAGKGLRRPGARGGGKQRGHGHGAKRHGVRDPGQRPRRGVVHRACSARQGTLPSRARRRRTRGSTWVTLRSRRPSAGAVLSSAGRRASSPSREAPRRKP